MFLTILSLVLNIALAQESSETYLKPCFNSATTAESAFKKLNFIKAPKDKIQVQGSCLDILTQEKRKKLYLSYLTQNFGHYDLQSIKPKQCRLIITKNTIKNSNSLSAGLDSKSLSILKEIQKSNKKEDIKLLMTSGSTQTISVNRNRLIKLNNKLQMISEKDEVKVKCIVSQKGFNIKVSANDQNNTLITNLFLKPNETYDLGSLTKSDNKDNKNIGLKGVKSNKIIIKELTYYKIRAQQ